MLVVTTEHHMVHWISALFINIFICMVASKEFCHNEMFTAECGSGEMIVMSEAKYGRMDRSRCIDKDYGFLSCGTDVLDVADYYCSGRQECTFRVIDDRLDQRKTCPKDLVNYLNASYVCQRTIITKRSCNAHTQVDITAEGGLFASAITRQTGCGSPTSPYIVRMGKGQRLNFTLYDYSYMQTLAPLNNRDARSVAYGALKDGDGLQPHTQMLYGTDKRTTHVYMSKTNRVQVILFATTEDRNFALEYKVIGCPDPPAPPYGWASRSHDQAVLGCNSSYTEEWKLVCINNKWQLHGNKLNCTQLAVTSLAVDWGSISPLMSINIEFGLALIAGIAFVIAALVILVGIIFIRRNYYRHSTPNATPEMRWPRNPQNLQQTHTTQVGQQQQEVTGKYSGSIRSQENEYASIQDNTYGTNGRSKYIHINLCHQGEPVGGGGGGGGNIPSNLQPDLVPASGKKEMDLVQYPEPKANYRGTSIVNNNNSTTGGQKQYIVVNTTEPQHEIIHDERAYSY